MKKLLTILLFLTLSLSANDPTIIKGKLKEVLEKKEEKTVEKKKNTKTGKVIQKGFQKNLQADIDQLNFKAFYTKDSIHRLMLEFDEQIIILETNAEFELKEERYRLHSFDEHQAQIITLILLKF